MPDKKDPKNPLWRYFVTEPDEVFFINEKGEKTHGIADKHPLEVNGQQQPTELALGEKKYGCLLCEFPEPLASRILTLASRIPKKFLAGDEVEERPHVTLKYGLHDMHPASSAVTLRGAKPPRVRLLGVSVFPAEDSHRSSNGERCDVVKIDVDSPDLHNLHDLICSRQYHTNTYADYKPHVTLAYVTAGKGEEAARLLSPCPLSGEEMTFREAIFSDSEGARSILPIGQSQADDEDENATAGEALAGSYAARWNRAMLSRRPIPIDEIEQAIEELEGTGWEVAQEADRFVARKLDWGEDYKGDPADWLEDYREMAIDRNRYSMRTIKRGPRRGQTAWYDTSNNRVMPRGWHPPHYRRGARAASQEPTWGRGSSASIASDGRTLALWYAELLNILDRLQVPTGEVVEDAHDELEDTGWAIEDTAHGWRAIPESQASNRTTLEFQMASAGEDFPFAAARLLKDHHGDEGAEARIEELIEIVEQGLEKADESGREKIKQALQEKAQQLPEVLEHVIVKSGKANAQDSAKLMAEILVALFDDKAEEVARDLFGGEGAEGFELANPGDVRYSKKPLGAGWVKETGKRGSTNRWVYQGAGAGAGAGVPPAPSAAPSPKPATGAAKPRKARPPSPRALAKTALDAATAKLGSGADLSDQEKQELINHLPRMTIAQLNKLRNAIYIHKYGWAGTPLKGLKAAQVSRVQSIIASSMGVPATPPPPPPPKPLPKWMQPPLGSKQTVQPPAAPATPASTSKFPVVPMKDEVTWETGKPQPGTLNGVDFTPAPPKFWEKVKDKDVGEPPSLRKVDRVSVMIQEPDGRIWIVKPTNAYGNRKHAMPGGGVEPGLTDQQNALKEIWEETGLQVEITGYAGDFEDSNNGNNGRLYIGKRIGGAPWDAKIESFIISQKTGKPAAESDEVMLVTPDRAAQLLHRTDDLAQLAVVRPIAANTPTFGKGSEPLKKLFKALEPKAKEYLRTHNNQGDGILHAVQEMRGFNAKPKIVSKSDMDNLVNQGGHVEMLRGIQPIYAGGKSLTSRQLADQFRDGEHFPGFGCFGNGTYADSNKGLSNKAYEYAGHYSPKTGSGSVVRMALPKSAKVIKQSELEKMVPSPPPGFSTSSHHTAKDQWLGIQAALAGYDAIEVDGKSSRHYSYGKGFYVVLNRGALVVQKEDASTHVIK